MCSPTGNTTLVHALPCGPENPPYEALCADGSPYLTDATWADIVSFYCYGDAQNLAAVAEGGSSSATGTPATLPSTGAKATLVYVALGLLALGALGRRLARRPIAG